MYKDSTNQIIEAGNRVKYRGRIYTIKSFIDGEGRFGTARIVFNEPRHTDEPADELSVDLVK